MAKATIDHDKIRKWAADRDGKPALGKDGKKSKGTEALQIDFSGNENEAESITWEEFFVIFEDNNLAFVADKDQKSRFNKFVDRDEADLDMDEDDDMESTEEDLPAGRQGRS